MHRVASPSANGLVDGFWRGAITAGNPRAGHRIRARTGFALISFPGARMPRLRGAAPLFDGCIRTSLSVCLRPRNKWNADRLSVAQLMVHDVLVSLRAETFGLTVFLLVVDLDRRPL